MIKFASQQLLMDALYIYSVTIVDFFNVIKKILLSKRL